MRVEETHIENEILLKLEAYARSKYEEELKREESLINQASNIQTVIAVASAALFMLLPILMSNRGNLSLLFIFINTSLITISLIFSLLFATLAQWRFNVFVLPKEHLVQEHLATLINDNAILIDNVLNRIISSNIELYNEVQEDRERSNNKRVKRIKISMYSFFLSVFFSAVFFILSVSKMWL